MLHPFGRHAREFSRAIGAGEWTRTDEGILFPRHGALLTGSFSWVTRDRAGREIGGGSQRNHIMEAGLAALRAGVISSAASTTPFFPMYVSLYGNNFAPGSVEWNAYYYATVVGELGDGPEGYTEPNRPAYVAARVSDHLISNSGSPATFTMATASTIPVYGFALHFDTNGKRDGVSALSPFDPSPVTIEDLTGAGGTDEIDPYYGVRQLFDGASTRWLDLNGDDFFDLGLGHWVDPSLEDIVYPGTTNTSLYAAVKFDDAPHSLANGDTESVTYDIRFTT